MKKILKFACCFIPTVTLLAQNINSEHMDTTIKPQNDFYNFVNGNWMKTTKIPADRFRWGSFDELREHTDSVSLDILNKILSSSYKNDSEEQKMKDLYNSFIDWDTRNKIGLSPILPYLKKVDEVKNLKDLQNLLIEFTPISMNPYYEYYVYSSPNNSNQNTVYLSSASLGLGRDYFQKNDEKSKEVLEQYADYISKLLKIIGTKKHQETAKRLVEYEKKIANSLLTVENIRNASLRNNPFSVNDLTNVSKNLNLPEYLNSLNVKVDSVIIPEKKYYKGLDSFISKANLDLVKEFIKLNIIRSSASYLTKELDEIQFDFYGKALTGSKEQRKIEKRALANLNVVMGEAFGKLYVKETFSPEAKDKAVELVNYLKKSYITHIKKLEWMSEPTKEKALEKLSKMSVKIGYPDKWKDYSKLKINNPKTFSKNEGSLYENILNYSVFEYNRMKDKIGKDVDKTEWGMTPQTVNAYYRSAFNEIVFPAAILQSPFYDYQADPAMNFGGIGAVIGHEMSHGFDDSGSQYDSDGNLKNWWTKEDKTNFEKVTNALAEQFSTYEPLPGVFVNGKFTLGENIGDLGGISIAYDALQLYFNDKEKPSEIDGFTQEQRFYISWAIVWRTKITDEGLKNQVKTDPHSPGYYRAIGPLGNLDSFHKAFNIKKSDKMFKPKDKRIIIW